MEERTSEELEEIESFFVNEVPAEDTEDRLCLRHLANAPHRYRRRPVLRKWRTFFRRLRNGEIILDNGEKLRMPYVKRLIFWLNRRHSPKIVIDIANGLCYPDDLTYKADKFGDKDAPE